ncbi:MAG: nuclear transport factor 2 family protein [Pyrinomonadaceae bacterium]
MATVAAVYSGCTNQQNSNSNANAVAVASAEPTPDKAAIETELTRIENDWPRIHKERDAAAIRKLEADDIILVYPDGVIGSKDQDIKDIESGSMSEETQEISDLTVNVLNNDSAIVWLRTSVKGGQYKTSAGQTQNTSGQFISVDTFARRNGQWQLVASATVPVRNPRAAALASPTARPSASAKPSSSPKPTPAAKPSPATKLIPSRAASPQRKSSPQ